MPSAPSPPPAELERLVARLAGRLLAERGAAPGPSERTAGVHVTTEPARPEVADGAAGARLAPRDANPRTTIVVGCDHGGVALADHLADWLRERGARVLRVGARDTTPTDWPVVAREVALAVADGRATLGVCVDGAGVGSAMAANRLRGVRAAACYDEALARTAREHDHANVLTLGASFTPPGRAVAILQAFLDTPFGGGRHARRVGLLETPPQESSA